MADTRPPAPTTSRSAFVTSLDTARADADQAEAAVAAFVAELQATPTRPPRDRVEATTTLGAPRWGLGLVALGVPVVLFAAIAAGVAVEFVLDQFGRGGATTFGRPAVVASLLVQQLAMIGWACGVSVSRGHGPRRDFDLRFDRIRDDVSFGLAVGVAAVCVAALVVMVLSAILGVGESVSNTQTLQAASGTLWLWVIGGLVVVGAPVSEELYFRGMLQTAGTRRFGPVLSVAVTSVLFALLHYNAAGWKASIVLLAAIGSVGLAMSVARHASQSLLPAIVGHMLFNALGVFPILVGGLG